MLTKFGDSYNFNNREPLSVRRLKTQNKNIYIYIRLFMFLDFDCHISRHIFTCSTCREVMIFFPFFFNDQLLYFCCNSKPINGAIVYSPGRPINYIMSHAVQFNFCGGP